MPAVKSEMSKRPMEILLIEDNQGDIELTQTAIANHKILSNLHVVKTGQEALQFLYRTESFAKMLRPDLILLDLNLPGMDGREVLERIKTDRDLRQIPVIVLTSAQAELDVLKSYSMGASCYLLKPVGPDNFSQLIHHIQDFWCTHVQLPEYELIEKYKISPLSSVPLVLQKKTSEAPLEVLFIEDSDADADIVLSSLDNLPNPGFIAHREIRLDDSFKYLENHKPDVVLLDLSLPDSEGFETVLRFRASHPFLPLVILTGAGEKTLGARAIAEGADDFLEKSEVQDELLGRTLRYAIERKNHALGLLEALTREKVARSEAEKAAEIRDEFLSIASHELRTPLTSLKLQVELLVRTLRMGEKDLIAKTVVQDFAVKTDGHIDRFSKLIDSLLNFSQIQSGRLRLDYQKFDLNQVVRDTLERFTPELKKAGCELTLNLGEPVDGEWDLLRVEQVLTNLISNGIKYGPGKPITVSVTADAEKVWILVKDEGPGIAAQDKEKIFQRFERAQINKAVPGLGLGLYVVRQIIDTHGGTIQLESELGAGSTFTVCLPRRRF